MTASHAAGIRSNDESDSLRMSRFLCLDDFEVVARRRLPHALYEFIAGGAETGASVRANRSVFERIGLVPRVLVDTRERSTRTSLFGRVWSAPFGIAPMGAMGVAAFQADLAMARAAAAENIPFVLSGSSLIGLERVVEANPEAWFQAYLSSDPAFNAGLVERVAAAGFRTLVITVDVPVAGNREADTRNGYASPLRPSLRLALDAALHPRWLAGTFARSLLAEGMPQFRNFSATPMPMLSMRLRRTPPRLHRRDNLCWDDLRRMRERWPDRLVLKGVLSAADVALARSAGIDGVIASNHGGRQLDGAVSPIEALPAMFAEAAGSPMALLCDGGVRRGSDVVKALGLGAKAVLIGRPMLYAAVADGELGVRRAIALLREEVHRNLALLGCTDLSSLGERIAPRQPVERRS